MAAAASADLQQCVKQWKHQWSCRLKLRRQWSWSLHSHPVYYYWQSHRQADLTLL
jgi:hypothetical protein